MWTEEKIGVAPRRRAMAAVAFTRTGLLASLARFARLYTFTWAREALHLLRGGEFPLTLRRASVLGGLGVGLPCLMLWNHLGQALDDLLFPRWRQQAVRKPVFMVGNARSGTTWAHRLLAMDEEHFTSVSLWHVLAGQSVTWRMLFHALGRVDAALGAPAMRLLRSVDRRVFGSSKVHPLSLWKPEEDELFMLNISACQLTALAFPLLDDFSQLIFFDETLPKAEQRAIFGYYRRCIQRHLYTEKLLGRRGARFLSKNPTFTLRLESLMEAFPDADVVVMVRDPHAAVPSMVSYIASCWHLFATPVSRYPFNTQLTAMCALHYTYPVQCLNREPGRARSMHFVRYESCRRALERTMGDLYRRLGLKVPPSMAAKLATEAKRAAGFVTTHKYTLEDTCGQDRAAFAAQHRAAFQLYPEYASRDESKRPVGCNDCCQ